MNCRDIEPLLLAERDGVLKADEHAALAKHLAACPACRKERLVYGEAITFLKTDAANVALPDVDTEWRTIRARLSVPGRVEKKPRLAPVIWFGASLAAAAALAVAFLIARSKPSDEVAPRPRMMAAKSINPGAATIAYVDKDSGWLVVWADEGDLTKRG